MLSQVPEQAICSPDYKQANARSRLGVMNLAGKDEAGQVLTVNHCQWKEINLDC